MDELLIPVLWPGAFILFMCFYRLVNQVVYDFTTARHGLRLADSHFSNLKF